MFRLGLALWTVFFVFLGSIARASQSCTRPSSGGTVKQSLALALGGFDPGIGLGPPVILDSRGLTHYSVGIEISDEFYKSWQLTSIPFGNPLKIDIEKLFHFYKRNYLSALALFNSTVITDNPMSLSRFSSINFLARSVGGNSKGFLYFETEGTRQESLDRGYKIRYEALFDVAEGTDWVDIPVNALRLNVDSQNLPSFLENQNIIAVGFDLMSSTTASKLEITPKLSLNLSLDNGLEGEQTNYFIDQLNLRRGTFHIRYEGRVLSEGELKRVLKKFFAAMAKKQNQDFGVSIAKQGLEAINHFLEAYKWKASTSFSKKVDLLDVIESLNRRDLFIEKGAFGKLHGSFAHHAQIISGLAGLTEIEGRIILQFISQYIAAPGESNNWVLWNIFFDSRNYSIHSNRFWRDRIR